MTAQVQHDMAIAYAQSKLYEYNMNKSSKSKRMFENKTNSLKENTDFSTDEIEYLKSAYVFARKNLSE